MNPSQSNTVFREMDTEQPVGRLQMIECVLFLLFIITRNACVKWIEKEFIQSNKKKLAKVSSFKVLSSI